MYVSLSNLSLSKAVCFSICPYLSKSVSVAVCLCLSGSFLMGAHNDQGQDPKGLKMYISFHLDFMSLRENLPIVLVVWHISSVIIASRKKKTITAWRNIYLSLCYDETCKCSSFHISPHIAHGVAGLSSPGRTGINHALSRDTRKRAVMA